MDYHLAVVDWKEYVRKYLLGDKEEALKLGWNALKHDHSATARYDYETRTVQILTCLENETENVVNHEVIHHVIAKHEGIETSIKFDKVTTKVYFEVLEAWKTDSIGF